MGGREEPPVDDPPWAAPTEGDEPEPEWAEQIRSGRRDRGAQLREVYSTFAEEPTSLDGEDDPE